jgi:hypothetical protein
MVLDSTDSVAIVTSDFDSAISVSFCKSFAVSHLAEGAGHKDAVDALERDSSRISGVGPVGDRVVQPGESFGFAHGRLAPLPHATQVVPTTRSDAVNGWRKCGELMLHEIPARGSRYEAHSKEIVGY